jgi:hypothetical protein
MREQAESLLITDLQQVKALADPLRQRIIGAMSAEPRTTKQVAAILDQPATKLYHHVEMLHRVGLLWLVESRPKRGTTEKYFQAVARQFAVGRASLTSESVSVIEDMFSAVFTEAISQVRHSVEAGFMEGEGKTGKTMLASAQIDLTSEQYEELRARLAQVLNEFRIKKGDGRRPFRILVATYPLVAGTAIEKQVL